MATEIAVIEVKNKALSLRDRAKALVVRDQETHDAAAQLYLGLTALAKQIDAVHDPAISAAHASHKAAIAAKQKSSGPVEEAKRILKPKVMAWEDAQERIRQEAERRHREEAERKHREEVKAAEEAAAKERAAAARIEEEARLELAAQAEAGGATAEQVDDILETHLYAVPEPAPYVSPAYVPPVVAPTFQKTSGFSSRWNYSAELVDIVALCKAVAVQPALAEYVSLNRTAANALARAMKEAFVLAGCKLKKERV